tara:strand:+ start:175 stop:462 length:288 start_codon:yes stop_codon:yes gene_type:complete
MTYRNDVFTHKTESFDFYIEYTHGRYFIHQDVRVWNKATFNATLLLIESLEWLSLRVCVLTTNTKLIKYSALYGFKYSYSQTSPDGVEYHILSRR